MKALALLALSSIGLMALCGCTNTVIGDGLGKESPDGQHSLAINSHGASGHAYVDKTKKRVYVLIRQQGNEKAVFQRDYTLVASDLGWSTLWQSPTNVVVVFFDFGDKMSSYDAKNSGARSNHVATLKFHRDSATGQFSEAK